MGSGLISSRQGMCRIPEASVRGHNLLTFGTVDPGRPLQACAITGALWAVLWVQTGGIGGQAGIFSRITWAGKDIAQPPGGQVGVHGPSTA